MKAAGYFVSIAVKFTAGMKFGHHNLNCRYFMDRVNVNWNTTSVVLDRTRTIRMKNDFNYITMAIHSLINRVVNYLIDKMMKTCLACCTDVHCRPFAYGLEAFQNLYLVCFIVV